MKFKLIAVLVLFFFSSDLAAQKKNDKYDYATFKDSRGTVLNYRILYPEGYNKNKKYPLILFLHGAGERGSDNESQLEHGADVFAFGLNEHPAIVIAPQCPKEDYWASAKFSRYKYPLDLDFNYSYPETNAFHASIELVKSFIKDKKADKKRVYVTGLSMGGMGTFEAVGRYPELFAAAMPICGGADLNTYGQKQAKVPFYIFHGDADSVVPVKHSREAFKKLSDLGAKVSYKEYPEVNHNSWDFALKETLYPIWFFQFKK
jgi:predicted peptidase